MADDGFQCNEGEQFETSTTCFRTADNPWVPGKHSWDEFIPKKGALLGKAPTLRHRRGLTASLLRSISTPALFVLVNCCIHSTAFARFSDQ